MEQFNDFFGGKQATVAGTQQMEDGFIENLSTLKLTEYEVRQIKHIHLNHKDTTYGELDLRILVDGEMVGDEPIHWGAINENLVRILIRKYNNQ